MRDRATMIIKLPTQLRDDLKQWAAEEHRSLTSLVVWILDRALRERR